MAKGYLIAQVTVTDPAAYARYAAATLPLLRSYGAKILVRPDTALVMEGTPRARTAIFEFDSFALAQAFWGSPEYAEAKALRAGAAEGDFMLMEGSD